MRPFNLKSSFSSFAPSHLHRPNTKPFLYTLLSSLSSLTKTPNPLFVDYLMNTFNFSETQSLKLATRFSHVKSLETPRAVVQYFQSLGFSEKQIQSSVRVCPQILLSDIDKTLKPKVEIFQQLGLAGSHLGEFFSKSSSIFTRSVEKLVPSIELLKKILGNDENNEDLLKILRRCCWLVCADMDSRLLPNIRFLESCGIVGDRLALLLRRRPRLLTEQEDALRNLVSRVSQMGFEMNSRMFVHALIAVPSCGIESFERKVEVFKSFGFSKDEYMEMVRKLPTLLNNSTKKSIVGLDFYLNTVTLTKEELIRNPLVLFLSMENRVLPRYRVLQFIKSKRLLKKEHNFLNLMKLTEDAFLTKFIAKFPNHVDQLLKAYEGPTLDRSSQVEISANCK